MKKVTPEFGYAIAWKTEARNLYSLRHYKQEIWSYCLVDKEDNDREYSPLLIFETRKMAENFSEGNKDIEIIKISITRFNKNK